jgi:hypothetical protein
MNNVIMGSANTRYSRLFLAGTLIVTVFGLLSSSIEGLAHVTHWSNFFGPTNSYIDYYALNLGIHPATWIFTVCAIGGFLGLFYQLKPKRTVLAFTSILFTSAGLVIPLHISRVTFPEANYFEVPWIGSYIILAGLSMMFLSFLAQKLRIRQIAIPVVIFLLALYAIYPSFIIMNSLPYVVYGARYFSVYSLLWDCTFVCILLLLMLLALTSKKQIIQWVDEKESKKGKI